MKILMPIVAIALCISMLIFPKETYEAASMGLHIWWTIVFPSLLPFFIVAELFLGLGIVHFMSILLEPIMRPIFNLPGCAAFVVALGYSSGFPVGASLTTSLRKQNLCTRLEGERLLSFTNNASPLFIFVAVSVGIFNRPSLGIILAIAHYGANLILGFLLRFFGRKDREQSCQKIPHTHLIFRSIQAMFEAQKKDGRSLGKLFNDAIRKSILSLATIGGFMILFSIVIKLLGVLGISQFIEYIIGLLLFPFHFPESLIKALSSGLFEMTLGTKMAGENTASLSQQVMAASMIMGWSGLSIHAQVAGIISESDLRFFPFFLTRIAHMILSGLLAFLLVQGLPAPVFSSFIPAFPAHTWTYVFIPFCAGLLIPVLLLVPLQFFPAFFDRIEGLF